MPTSTVCGFPTVSYTTSTPPPWIQGMPYQGASTSPPLSRATLVTMSATGSRGRSDARADPPAPAARRPRAPARGGDARHDVGHRLVRQDDVRAEPLRQGALVREARHRDDPA